MIVKNYNRPIPPYFDLDSKGNISSNKLSEDGKVFYDFFKKSFKNGVVIKINLTENIWPNNYDKYLKQLLQDLEKEYFQHEDLNLFFKQYNDIKKNFDIGFRWDFYKLFVDFLIKIKEFEMAWEEWNVLRLDEWGTNYIGTYRSQEVFSIIDFEKFLNRKLVDGTQIYHIAKKGHQLTTFGKKNRNEVLEILSIILKSQQSGSFFDKFFKNDILIEKKREPYAIEYYEQFFEHGDSFKKIFKSSLSYSKIEFEKLKKRKASKTFVYEAISSEASRLLREAENEYRTVIGAKKIGEGWISETELFYRIKSFFIDLEVIHHGKPEWLGRQHFDIWIPELNIAIEYQGNQHFLPIAYFGGEESFKRNVERDNIKKQKCKLNNCKLLEVKPGYNLSELISEIKISLNGSSSK